MEGDPAKSTDGADPGAGIVIADAEPLRGGESVTAPLHKATQSTDGLNEGGGQPHGGEQKGGVEPEETCSGDSRRSAHEAAEVPERP
jgi:hypothetical protein